MRTINLLSIAIVLILVGCSTIKEKVREKITPEPVVEEPVASPYTITHVGRNKIAWTGPDLPWPAGGNPVSSACAEGHLYRVSDGKGGKFDWIRPNTKERDFKNVHSGYWTRKTGESKPVAGERMRLVAVNRWHHSERIVIGEFTWK